MTTLRILIALVLLSTTGFGQTTKNELLVGDWIEIRREGRTGYIYTIGGALEEPSIELSFSKSGIGSFYNPHTPDPKSFQPYFLLGDSLIIWKAKTRNLAADLVSIDKDKLTIIIRWRTNEKSEHLDQKCHFIRKDKYNSLSKADIAKFQAPTKKDIAYKDSIIARRSKNYVQPRPDFLMIADVMPQFPDGYDSLKKFVKKNLVYPKSLTKEGNVFVQFIVETDGKLSNIIVLKGLSPDSDKEALRIVKLMPRWKPGLQNNKTARVQTSIPIMFRQ